MEEARDRTKARRIMQRARRADVEDEIFQQLWADFKRRKRLLNKKIIAERKARWKDLINEVDHDVWGLGYKIVAKFSGGSKPQNLGREKEGRVLRDLFLRVGPTAYPQIQREENPSAFTPEELSVAVAALRNKKAPGQNRIPSEAIKLFHKVPPEFMLQMYNELLCKQTFHAPWRTARIILLLKQGKDPENSDAYRPISLLSAISKVYEHLISARIDKALGEDGGLSSNQFGFREGRSTTDALNQVTSKATDITQKWMALVTLDVKNAFNSVRWELIVITMISIGLPNYIIVIIMCYLSGRAIRVNNNSIDVEAGIPQGSVLGPKIWNLTYDPVLRLPLAGKAWIFGSVDDLGMLVAADTSEELTLCVNLSLKKVETWLKDHDS